MTRSIKIPLLAALMIGAGMPAMADPPTPGTEGGTSYGRFLAGRVAMNRGDSAASSAYFADALAGSGGEQIARERTLSSAILAGDVASAASVRLAAGESPASLVEAGRLAQAVQGMIEGRSRTALGLVEAEPISGPHRLAGALFSRWLAADANDWERALEPAAPGADAMTQIFTSLHRAQLLERRRRFDEADALYGQMMLNGSAAPLFRLPYGEFLERRRRPAEAVALYDAGLAQGADPALAAARARAAARGRAPELLTVRQGAARALSQAAVAAVVARAPEFAVAYLRYSLALDPTDGDSWLRLGQALNEIGMPTTAREAWASVPAGSPAWLEAQVQLALSLDEAGQGDEAVRVARAAVAARSADAGAAYALAGLLAGHEEYEQALQALDSPALAGLEGDWRILYMRGAALERLGRHAEAETAFLSSLQTEPGAHQVQNHLGYMWIDGGTRIDEGLALVEQAVAAEPDSGAYQDSLGWGRYRQGRYDEAVRILEHAASLDAASAVINDHLGDAYWQVGRRREAQYQWRRVLTLDAGAALRAQAQAKLAGGLQASAGASQGR